MNNGKNFIDLCKIIDPAGESKGNVQNWFPEVINFFVGHRKEFPSRPSNKVTAKELKSLTAVLIPELEIQQGKNKHDDMELIIVSRKNWLEKHGIIPKDSLIDNLIGINTGMNALSHFLSRLLPFLSDKDENQKLVLEAMDQRIHYTDVERIQVRNSVLFHNRLRIYLHQKPFLVNGETIGQILMEQSLHGLQIMFVEVEKSKNLFQT